MNSSPQIPAETLSLLEWKKIIRRVEDLCGTDAGKSACRGITFSCDPDLLRRTFAEISQMRQLIASEKPLEITYLPIIRDELEAAKAGGVLSAETLASILRGLKTSERIRRYFREKKGKYNLISYVAKHIPDLSDLVRFMDEKITEEGEVRETASPLLKQLKSRLEAARQRVVDTANAIMDHPKYRRHLQDRFVTVRGGRSVLPFKPSIRGISRGILHETSHTGQTLFFEPEELVHANNELAQIQSEYDEEIRKILARVSGEVGEKSEEIATAFETAGKIDLIQAKALFGEEIKGTEPNVNLEGKVEILKGRHPALVLSGKNVVPNDVKFGGEKRCLIITGPNAGGKTVLLKMVGLLCLMTMAGLPIPAAPDTRIPLFSKILIAMGDMQEIEKDLSTFSADILTLMRFYEECDKNTLVLLDEVITGTDPREGGALGKAYLKKLVDRGAVAVVTTHFEEVKYLPFEDRRFAVATMGFSEENLTPTYRMMEGIPGRSMGISVAEKLGFPREIIESAKKELGKAEAVVEELVRELNSLKEEQERLKKDLESEKELVRAEKKKLEEQLRKIREKREAILDEAKKKSLSIIARADSAVKEVMEELKRDRKVEVVRRASDVLRNLKKEVGTQEPPPELKKKISNTRPVKNPEELRQGIKVFVPSLGKDGIVESVDKGWVVVSFGVAKMRLEQSSVRLYGREKKERDKRKALDVPSGSGQPELRTEVNTVDVRGLIGEDAIERVDQFLDSATLMGLSTVYVIHGHGTGTLKKRIREYLKNSPYVSEYAPAPQHEGGDGVTIVKLK